MTNEADVIVLGLGPGGEQAAADCLAGGLSVIGIEAEGSPVLLRALEAGRNIALERVTTSVATMACAKTDDAIFEMVQARVDEIVLVGDDEMRTGSGSH